MDVSQLYTYVSVLIFVPWALLLFAPRWRYTAMVAFLSALVLSLLAAYFTYLFLTDGAREGHLLSAEGLKNLFRHPAMLMTGWFNYLSFSLLIGIWQVHDARAKRLPHWLVVPTLLLTLLGGPVGALVYSVLRFFRTGKWQV